jgi:hypothetical protein
VKGCTLSKMEHGRKMVAVGVGRRTSVDPRVCEGVCVFHFASAGSGGLTSGFNRNRMQEREERRTRTRSVHEIYLFICRDKESNRARRWIKGGSPEPHAHAQSTVF